MTDPNQPQDAPADPAPDASSEPAPGVPAEPGPGAPSEPAVGWAIPTPPPEPAVAPDAGWVAPAAAPSKRRTGCILGCVVVAVGVPLLLVIGLIFLGGQVASILKGTTQFGTGGTECVVTGSSSTFTTSQQVHVVLYLKRQMVAGDTGTLSATRPDGSTLTEDESFTGPTDCVYLDVGPGLEQGSYTFEFSAGGEVLSTGTMQITP